MKEKILIWLLAIFFPAIVSHTEAQQSKMYRVGVLVPGEAWYEIIDGLRVGLKQLGLEEGKHISLEIGRVMQRRPRRRSTTTAAFA